MSRPSLKSLLHKASASGAAVLFDGAIGTRLQAMGLAGGEAPESWNLRFPDRVEAVHRAYRQAGARVLTTNSFGGSRYRLSRRGIDTVYQVNFQAGALARRAAGEVCLVAGSVGPTGEFLRPLGSEAPETVREAFRMQVRGLMDGGADLIVIETMTALDEAVEALRAARELGDIPVIVSMTFDAGGAGYRTSMGVDIPTAVHTLLSEGADGVGTNCGQGIVPMIPVVRAMAELTDLPVLAEPNAGMPELAGGQTVYRETPAMMAESVPALVDAGAAMIGGCCGTTPDHIHAFSEQLKSMGK